MGAPKRGSGPWGTCPHRWTSTLAGSSPQAASARLGRLAQVHCPWGDRASTPAAWGAVRDHRLCWVTAAWNQSSP